MTSLMFGDASAATEAVRSLFLMLASVIFGMSFLVTYVYSKRVLHRGGRRWVMLPTHVALISLSYSLLILTTAGTQFQFLVEDREATWRMPFVALAYALGIAGLRLILLHINRVQQTPCRREDDPPRLRTRGGEPS